MCLARLQKENRKLSRVKISFFKRIAVKLEWCLSLCVLAKVV